MLFFLGAVLSVNPPHTVMFVEDGYSVGLGPVIRHYLKNWKNSTFQPEHVAVSFAAFVYLCFIDLRYLVLRRGSQKLPTPFTPRPLPYTRPIKCHQFYGTMILADNFCD